MSVEGHEYHRFFVHPCEEVFDLVADIERYPAFVPGFLSARILRRETDTLYVHQQFGFGPVHYGFDSVARFERPNLIEIRPATTADPGFFMRWDFEPRPGGCEVRLRVRGEGGGMLGELIELLPINVILAAFGAQADARSGSRQTISTWERL